MKWGRKKSSSSSASASPLVSFSQVFPISWLSKFKQMSSISKAESDNPAKSKCEDTAKSFSRSPIRPVSFKSRWSRGPSVSPDFLERRKGRSVTKLSEIESDDAFWRLSFGGSSEGKKSRGVLSSVWYDSNDEIEFPGCRSKEEGKHKFNDMISDIRKVRLPVDEEIMPENEKSKGEELETPRRRIAKDQRVQSRRCRRTFQRIMEEDQSVNRRESIRTKQKSTESVEKAALYLELEPVRTIQTIEKKSPYRSSSNSRNNERRTTEENRVFAAPDSNERRRISVEELNWKHKTEKDSVIEELRLRSEKQRKSASLKGTKQSCKVKVYSPRTASKMEICKIKALEDMKAKQKRRTKTNERQMKGTRGLESFAVVKCSFDPQKDFRDSMVEMISEKRMRQPEELEELLACYLSLNSEEYHDIIVDVFRQIWLDLNKNCSYGLELQKDPSYYD